MTKKTKRAFLAALAAALLAAALAAPGAEASFSCFEGAAEAAPPGSQPGYGVAPGCFDGQILAGESGSTAYAQAAGHPYSTSTTIDLNTRMEAPFPGEPVPWPEEPAKDIRVDVPPGLVGNPTAVAQCTMTDLARFPLTGVNSPQCSAESQVGIVQIRTPLYFAPGGVRTAEFPLYSIVPPPTAPARFGFNIAGVVVTLDSTVRSGSDYGVSIDARNISEGISILGTDLTLWGTPADPAHDAERVCLDSGSSPCESKAAAQPFLRMPTSCAEAGVGLPFTLQTDSWFNPGAQDALGKPVLSDPNWKQAGFTSHDPPGLASDAAYPRSETPDLWGPQRGTEECASVPFRPEIEAAPTTDVADSPSGLDFHLRVPQDCWEHPEETCSSDLRDAEVKLPQGMTLNPAAASGLGSCTEAQIGYRPGTSEPFQFDSAPASCPDDSKIGKATIETPLLEEPLSGAVYLAKQSENPSGSLLAMYLVAEGSGVLVKQAGEIEVGPGGRLTTVFHDAPQTPFSDLHLELFGGPSAPLRTPPACGTFAVTAKLTPWSGGPAANASSGFEIGSCPSPGFNPKLSAGTQNPLAGATSPFSLRLTREDGEGEIASLQETLPPGLSGYLKGIPYCPEAALAAVSGELGTGVGQEHSPSCPSASQVGTLTVAAGAGPDPFYTSAGRAYLAGPYKGAPLSIAAVIPAVAGPFDLGSVLVRNALRIDPETAQVSVASDPLPTILHGIPVDARDIRVDLNRSNFTLNPTSCEPMSIASTLTSSEGATASPSQHFQLGECGRLAFKPKLSLRLSGKTKRSGNPSLRATLTMPQKTNNANIARAAVTLPHSEFLDQAHIRTICTRVQYAAGGGGGEQCPEGSVYGHARAFTPLLDQPLEGPVYLRSSDHPLPDLVASLGGQIHVDLVGRIDSVHGGIRNTFDLVPDAPVSKFVLIMQGGKKSLLENSTNLCAGTHRATALFDGQNGKTHDLRPQLKADCGKGHKR